MKNKIRVPKASSLRNGIVFMSGVTNQLQVKSYFDSRRNSIETIIRWHDDFKWNRGIDRDLKGQDIISKKEEKLVETTGWFINLLLIIYTIFVARDIRYIVASVYYSFTASKYLYVSIYQSFKMKVLNNDGKKLARYHSAEHMILNAYHKLGKVPSLDEIKTFSRFSQYCGSRALMSKIIAYIPNSLAIAFCDEIHFITFISILIISYIISRKLLEKDFIKIEQILFTEPPTDLELEVAIKGLETLVKEEEKIKEMMSITYVV